MGPEKSWAWIRGQAGSALERLLKVPGLNASGRFPDKDGQTNISFDVLALE
jgi:hypothetical protein